MENKITEWEGKIQDIFLKKKTHVMLCFIEML
jgi:hypothetical protein